MNSIPAMFCVDSYKLGHADQYPSGTTKVYSNFTPRDLRHFLVPQKFENGFVIAYGMYATVIEITDAFYTTFFDRALDDVMDEIEEMYPRFTGKELSDEDCDRYMDLHDYGRLPITIKALPEGTHIKPQIPVMTIINTQPEFFWVTNFLEVWLSNTLWKPMVSATVAWNYRRILDYYAKETGTPKELVNWQGHDFSLRGMSGMEDGARTGAGHLMSFTGSDNIPAAWYLKEMYHVDKEDTLAGSVPATEHSVMSCGSKERELDTFKRIITDVCPKGIVSIVSDTWDFWEVITQFTKKLHTDIMSRDGKVVFRPDSGDPGDILCGTATLFDSGADESLDYMPAGVYNDVSTNEYWEIKTSGSGTGDFFTIEGIRKPTPEMRGAVECLWEVFGGTTTSSGHRLLDEHVGLIYGDSITMQRAQDILDKLSKKGFASGNVVLGIGSYTYQYVTRDTIGAAMKATYAEVNGEARNLFKNPATDVAKKSATGLLRVLGGGEDYVLEDQASTDEGGMLDFLLIDGIVACDVPKLSDIREKVRGT